MLTMVIIFLVGVLVLWMFPITPLVRVIATVVVAPIYLLNIAWSVVGALMFWGDIELADTCGQALETYMWFILILGFVMICYSCSLLIKGCFSY